MRTMLLVDDESRMLNLLELYLRPAGYSIVKVNNGHEAIQIIRKKRIDAVLLDIMMPELSGWETCERIRSFSPVPIIMLTARDTKEDVIKGLNAGADDYITKPFDEEELLARVNALLRRENNEFHSAESLRLSRGEFTLDFSSYTFHHGDNRISLTMKEFKLLEALMKNPERVYTRDQLLVMVWDVNATTETRTVDSHIRNLRDKLKRADFPIEEHLTTVWGIGYQWKI
ncbi:response regulator transcription factor [Rossellomorea aquimaris]|uniref:response regulator transcription factor n=1 Tax=Rossellomorea aquimaris TaxID=189382 RepID=UPI001CD60C4B|nr:response regulator transcription factor [Rossellomorea aquimaris]MCA1055344.1 response regulator transcription factor [Rossellomorea aquimaris]